jgi:hypothetical protein
MNRPAKIAAALALLFSAGIAGAAATHDRTIDLGLLGTAHIGNSFAVGTAGVMQGDGFVDTYRFTTDHGGSFAQAAIVSFSFGNLLGLDNLTLRFSDTQGTLLASTAFSAANLGDPSFASLTLNSPPLAAGDEYRFIVSGTINAQSGSYGGVLAVPIPEPQTYLLMLAGLGLVGCAAWRRHSRVSHLHCATASAGAMRSAASV